MVSGLVRDETDPRPDLALVASVIAAEDPDWPGRDAYSELLSRGYHGQSWIVGDHKLVQIQLGGEHWFLYDLAADPGEHHSRVELDPERVADLREGLEAAVARYSAAPQDSTTLDLSEEMEAQLRALGYLD